ncbi:MAG: hypothetical protein ACK4MV_01670 [Beijerinckiaceae bacterium]
MKAETPISIDEYNAAEERRAASSFVAESFAEGILAGIEPVNLAHAAIAAALNELIASNGEESVARYAESLARRIRLGEFSALNRH